MNYLASFLSVSSLVASVLLLSACQQTKVATPVSEAPSHSEQAPVLASSQATADSAEPKTSDRSQPLYRQTYSKPGAAITIRHSIEGPLDVGETHEFNVLMVPGLAGELAVTLTTPEAIQMYGLTELEAAVSAGEFMTIPVSLLITEEGQHYLRVHATLTANGVAQSKSFSIAIDTPASVATRSTKSQSVNTGETIKFSQAQETIIREP